MQPRSFFLVPHPKLNDSDFGVSYMDASSNESNGNANTAAATTTTAREPDEPRGLPDPKGVDGLPVKGVNLDDCTAAKEPDKPRGINLDDSETQDSRCFCIRHCSWKRFFSIVLFSLLMFGCFVAIGSGVLQDAVTRLSNLGIVGWICLTVVFIVPGMPFGWGYSILLLASGFAFGWEGLISSEVGTVFGSISGFMLSRHFLRAWVLERIQHFKPSVRSKLTALQQGLLHGSRGFLVICAMRNSAFLTFGWVNAFIAISDCGVTTFVTASFVSAQPYIIMYVNIGRCFREVGKSMADDGEKPDSVRQQETAVLILSIVGSVVLVFVTGWYSKIILKDIGNANTEDDEENRKVTPMEASSNNVS